MFLKLRGRRCLVVGAGKISEGKIKGLLESGAKVWVIAPKASEHILRWHKAKRLRLTLRTFRPGDLAGMFLVVAATNSPKVHASIYREARALGVLCNIVDVPALCDFYYPAVVRRGELQIAISTAGASPSLASRLRQELEVRFGPEYAAWLKQLSRERKEVRAKRLSLAEQLAMLKEQASGAAFLRFLRGASVNIEKRRKKGITPRR
jgi:precorrin-2 dehydrogenase / sirohydrochlorin ferrochelatase